MDGFTLHYPKLLAFLQLVYPSMFEELARFSSKSDLVQAKLISTSNLVSYQTIVFSQGGANKGEIYQIFANNTFPALYSWDWRWVFALNVIYESYPIFPIKFKQKVIALPTGRYPLSTLFFKSLSDEFSVAIQNLIDNSTQSKKPISEIYASYISSINIESNFTSIRA